MMQIRGFGSVGISYIDFFYKMEMSDLFLQFVYKEGL